MNENIIKGFKLLNKAVLIEIVAIFFSVLLIITETFLGESNLFAVICAVIELFGYFLFIKAIKILKNTEEHFIDCYVFSIISFILSVLLTIVGFIPVNISYISYFDSFLNSLQFLILISVSLSIKDLLLKYGFDNIAKKTTRMNIIITLFYLCYVIGSYFIKNMLIFSSMFIPAAILVLVLLVIICVFYIQFIKLIKSVRSAFEKGVING